MSVIQEGDRIYKRQCISQTFDSLNAIKTLI